MRDKIDFILQFGRISNMQILEVVNLIIITAIGSPPPVWRCGPTRAMASTFLRFLDHTRRITLGRTPLDA